MKKTNFDAYLEEQLRDPDFAKRFKRAGEAWDVALQIAALREPAGVSQKQLARKLHISQQQISRLESPSYEGHSLSRLRRVAKVLRCSTPGSASCLKPTMRANPPCWPKRPRALPRQTHRRPAHASGKAPQEIRRLNPRRVGSSRRLSRRPFVSEGENEKCVKTRD